MSTARTVFVLGLLAGCGSDAGDEPTASGDVGSSGVATLGMDDLGDEEESTGGDTGSDGSGSATGDGPLPPGIACDDAFEHEGRAGCETVVEGLGVKFFPLDPGERVERLAVFLHGDGAADYTDNWGFSADILEWTRMRNTMVVGVLAPSFYEDGTVAFGAAQPEHADAVALTLEAFLAAYEPEHADETLYWGVSGGSWFFTSSFVARVGHRVPGVVVASCGGSGFSFGWAWDPMTDTTTRDAIPFYFNYGTEDFLAPGIVDSIAEYQGLGFEVDSLVHRGAMHCDHPISGPTIDFWSRHVP